MLRALFHTVTWVAIAVGTIATPVAIYVALNGTVHDGSIAHGPLWQQVFGSAD